MAKQSEAISLVEIAAESPRRIHQVLEANVSSTPDRVALVEARASWTYLELDRSVTDIAAALKSLGVRAGDRMIISENCIALAALLLAASRIVEPTATSTDKVLKHKLAESLQSA